MEYQSWAINPQKDGIVQVWSAKIQPEPAKMQIVTYCISSSGERGFGFDRSKIYFIGERL